MPSAQRHFIANAAIRKRGNTTSRSAQPFIAIGSCKRACKYRSAEQCSPSVLAVAAAQRCALRSTSGHNRQSIPGTPDSRVLSAEPPQADSRKREKHDTYDTREGVIRTERVYSQITAPAKTAPSAELASQVEVNAFSLRQVEALDYACTTPCAGLDHTSAVIAATYGCDGRMLSMLMDYGARN